MFIINNLFVVKIFLYLSIITKRRFFHSAIETDIYTILFSAAIKTGRYSYEKKSKDVLEMLEVQSKHLTGFVPRSRSLHSFHNDGRKRSQHSPYPDSRSRDAESRQQSSGSSSPVFLGMNSHHRSYTDGRFGSSDEFSSDKCSLTLNSAHSMTSLTSETTDLPNFQREEFLQKNPPFKSYIPVRQHREDIPEPAYMKVEFSPSSDEHSASPESGTVSTSDLPLPCMSYTYVSDDLKKALKRKLKKETEGDSDKEGDSVSLSSAARFSSLNSSNQSHRDVNDTFLTWIKTDPQYGLDNKHSCEHNSHHTHMSLDLKRSSGSPDYFPNTATYGEPLISHTSIYSETLCPKTSIYGEPLSSKLPPFKSLNNFDTNTLSTNCSIPQHNSESLARNDSCHIPSSSAFQSTPQPQSAFVPVVLAPPQTRSPHHSPKPDTASTQSSSLHFSQNKNCMPSNISQDQKSVLSSVSQEKSSMLPSVSQEKSSMLPSISSIAKEKSCMLPSVSQDKCCMLTSASPGKSCVLSSVSSPYKAKSKTQTSDVSSENAVEDLLSFESISKAGKQMSDLSTTSDDQSFSPTFTDYRNICSPSFCALADEPDEKDFDFTYDPLDDIDVTVSSLTDNTTDPQPSCTSNPNADQFKEEVISRMESSYEEIASLAQDMSKCDLYSYEMMLLGPIFDKLQISTQASDDSSVVSSKSTENKKHTSLQHQTSPSTHLKNSASVSSDNSMKKGYHDPLVWCEFSECFLDDLTSQLFAAHEKHIGKDMNCYSEEEINRKKEIYMVSRCSVFDDLSILFCVSQLLGLIILIFSFVSHSYCLC